MFFKNNLNDARTAKGFTLVELLIVIAILAILAAAVVVVINPGQLLAQARDAQRMNDLPAVRDALMLFIAQSTPSTTLLGAACTPATFRTSSTVAIPAASNPFTSPPVNTTIIPATDVRTIASAGWVGVRFDLMPGGSPLSILPIDPINDGTLFYAFACDNTAVTFELAGRLESVRHRGIMATDGGDRNCFCGGATEACTSANITTMTAAQSIANNCFWELGTDPGLNM